jgi:nucleoside-diphosphate-sugar epimerase
VKPIVLLTGANGFVGSHVAEALLAGGYAVRCLLRPHSKPAWIETLPVDIQRADYEDANGLARILDGCQAILHFGGATKAPDRDAHFRANAGTTQALLEAAARACPDLQLFLLCSSQAALGPSPSLDPLSEDAPPSPITTYGHSKLAAERICREYESRFPIAILRPPAVYGPRDKDIFIFFKLVKYGIAPTIGSRDRYFSLVHAADVAQITRLILGRSHPPEFRLYHVTDGAIHRWTEVSGAIAHAMNRRPLNVRVPMGLALAVSKVVSKWSSAAGRVSTLNREKLDDLLQQYWLISSQRAVDELGYAPKWDIQAGVEMTAQWYKEKGWL